MKLQSFFMINITILSFYNMVDKKLTFFPYLFTSRAILLVHELVNKLEIVQKSQSW